MSSLPLLAFYALFLLICLHGVHRALLCLRIVYGRITHGRNSSYETRSGSDETEMSVPRNLPHVAVQLPIFEEYYVADRLVEAVAAIDWPRDRLEIQVLDDSRDETRDILAARVVALQQKGFAIQHLHRSRRTGYKAGALAAGLQSFQDPARGEFVAIFDADFVPEPDFLRRAIPVLQRDEKLAVVQGRWTHLNRSHSWLTRAQACFLDAHFAVEHEARQRSQHFLNFNGTAGVWRRRAIEDAGGWTHDTLTEDLDISFRAQLRGWRFAYLHDLEVPAELPIEMRGFKQQQRRWVKGSLQCARKLLWRTWTSPGPRLTTRIEASIHLLNNLTWPVMLGATVLSLPVAFEVAAGESWWTENLDRGVLAFGLLPVLCYFFIGQRRCGRSTLQSLLVLPLAVVLGMGLVVNGSRAAIAGLFGKVGAFERTPKFHAESNLDSWLGKRYRQSFDATAMVELILAIECGIAAIVAIRAEAYGFAVFVALFSIGLALVATTTMTPRLIEHARTRFARGRRAKPGSDLTSSAQPPPPA